MPGTDLAARICARFVALGDFQFPVEPREPVRPSPRVLCRTAWLAQRTDPRRRSSQTLEDTHALRHVVVLVRAILEVFVGQRLNGHSVHPVRQHLCNARTVSAAAFDQLFTDLGNLQQDMAKRVSWTTIPEPLEAMTEGGESDSPEALTSPNRKTVSPPATWYPTTSAPGRLPFSDRRSRRGLHKSMAPCRSIRNRDAMDSPMSQYVARSVGSSRYSCNPATSKPQPCFAFRSADTLECGNETRPCVPV